MADVIRTLGESERGNYMPFDELFDKHHRNEVYEAVGEMLMLCYEMDGEISGPGDLLVELYGGIRVSFSYGECITLEAIQ